MTDRLPSTLFQVFSKEYHVRYKESVQDKQGMQDRDGVSTSVKKNRDREQVN